MHAQVTGEVFPEDVSLSFVDVILSSNNLFLRFGGFQIVTGSWEDRDQG